MQNCFAVCGKKIIPSYFSSRFEKTSTVDEQQRLNETSPIFCDAILPGVTCSKFNSHYIYMIIGCLGSEKLSYRLRWKVFRVKVSLAVCKWSGTGSPLFNPDLIRKARNTKYYECSASLFSGIIYVHVRIICVCMYNICSSTLLPVRQLMGNNTPPTG